MSESISPETLIEKKDKKKKMKNTEETEQLLDSSKQQKKEKKLKKSKTNSKASESDDSDEKSSKKKEKKRKAALEADNESETSSELVEPMSNSKIDESVKKNKKKKMKLIEDSSDEEQGVDAIKEEDPNAVKNFRISEPLRNALKSKGIEALFPIQAMTFNTILDGSDLVGRARTGQVTILP